MSDEHAGLVTRRSAFPLGLLIRAGDHELENRVGRGDVADRASGRCVAASQRAERLPNHSYCLSVSIGAVPIFCFVQLFEDRQRDSSLECRPCLSTTSPSGS